MYPSLSTSVSGILFLGTPHRGSSTASYANVLSQIANTVIIGGQLSRLTGSMRTDLVRQLETNEKDLLNISEDFRVQTSSIRIASFIEQTTMKGRNHRVYGIKAVLWSANTDP